jgi:uncharacterized protein (DUF488 family)
MTNNNAQPTYRRQRFLLAFIRQLRGSVTSTDLQKLVFLYTMKENSEFYEFIPYKFGSYSFQLAEDIEILRRDGYLSTETSRIEAIVDYPLEESFTIESERGDRLICKAYREYPYYAINSEITHRLFRGAETEQFKLEKQNYVQTSQVLFTIGYEGKSIEAFMNALIQNDIRLLCDIRRNPLSRKFGFSKNKLEHVAETVGIKYIHIPELGIEHDKRSSLESVDDYICLFEEYAKTLPDRMPQLELIYSLLRSKNRIALTCYEKEPQMCHRHVVRDYIATMHEIRSVDL